MVLTKAPTYQVAAVLPMSQISEYNELQNLLGK